MTARKTYFGAWVTLEDAQGVETRYRIVGADEFDEHEHYITVDAPLSRLLLGKSLDDEIEFAHGGKTKYYVIVAIDYDF